MSGSALRYRTLRAIGQGGMGSVDLVWDEERQEELARKRILGALGESLVRFKREFRAIAGIRHENLVRLHELDEDDEGPYFTMEYVRGEPLLRHCGPSDAWSKEALTETQAVPRYEARPSGVTVIAPGPSVAVVSTMRSPWQCNWERLEQVIPQIARALDHLHASGVVHCDLKPGNTMVSAGGVVKLLDFGVVAEMQGRRGPGNAIIAGTPAYMAPERLQGAAAAPPVDLYALGVLLFELISGALPFDGISSLITLQHIHDPPPPLRSRVPDAPVRYEELCFALLAKDPSKRATTRDVLAVLGQTTNRSIAPLRPRGEAMVGRTTLQAALRGRADLAARGAFVTANLQGPSGSGKTALALWLARDLEPHGWLVLRGRASTSERVAFNALDGVIDDLASALADPTRARLCTTAASPLRDAAMLFPVLRDLAAESGTPGEAGTRGRGFDAVGELLAAVAAQSPILLIVDDVQWADADSMALLDALATRAPARVLLVMTTRDDVGAARALPWLRKRMIEPLLVGPMDDASVHEVIARAARTGGARPSKEAIARVASAAAGRPFLAEALGRALAHEPEAEGDPLEGVASAIERASIDARVLLAFALAAGGWMPIATLAQAMDRKAGEVANLAAELETAGLLRRDASAATLGAVDVYHDQVRERAMGLLDGGELSRAHERFVAWFAGRPGTAPSVIVHHLVGAGRIEEAASLAREAARVAEEQRAFDLASAMYEVALRHPSPDRIALLGKRALALERVGAYAAAATCWREVAGSLDDPDARNEAILHEAHALLGDNQIAQGYARLNEALVARGEPPLGPSRAGDLWSGLRFVTSAFTSSAPDAKSLASPPPADVDARMTRAMSVGQFVAYFDPLAGINLMRRSRTAAARAGANDAVAFCDYTFAYFTLFGARKAGEAPLYKRFRERADRFAGPRADEPQNAAWRTFLDGVVAMREGRWDVAAERMDTATAWLQRAGEVGTQSTMYVLFARAEVEMWRQNIFGYEHTYDRIRTAVDESQTGAMRCQFEMSAALLRCWAGDMDGATRIMTELQRSWPSEVRTVQQLVISLGLMMVHTFRGEASLARALAARLEAREQGYDPLASIYGTAFANTAAMAEVTALRSGDRLASAKAVRRYARLVAEGPPFGRATAIRALAYLDEHEGNPTSAMVRFEAGEREALAFGQRLDAALCRFARGKRLGGDAGAALITSARALLVETGVSEKFLTLTELG